MSRFEYIKSLMSLNWYASANQKLMKLQKNGDYLNTYSSE